MRNLNGSKPADDEPEHHCPRFELARLKPGLN
jgi:hypothetical protein